MTGTAKNPRPSRVLRQLDEGYENVNRVLVGVTVLTVFVLTACVLAAAATFVAGFVLRTKWHELRERK